MYYHSNITAVGRDILILRFGECIIRVFGLHLRQLHKDLKREQNATLRQFQPAQHTPPEAGKTLITRITRQEFCAEEGATAAHPHPEK